MALTILQKPNDGSQYSESPVLWIDDFLNFYDQKYITITSEENAKIQPRVIQPSSFQDAVIITQIYEDVYHGTYPYKEMLDPHYVFASFTSPKYWWGMFQIHRDVQPEYEGKIIGCLTVEIDSQQKVGYFRGLLLLPEFQGRGLGARLCYSSIYTFLTERGDEITKWYNENRTAHSISQHLTYCMGGRPFAIYPQKDYFLGAKETDVLMIGYKKDFLSTNRNPPKRILKWMQPIYQIAANFHKLAPIGNCDPSFEINNEKIKIVRESTKISKLSDQYGYSQLRFQNCIKGDFIQCIYTKSVNNIEKFKFQISSLESFVALFQKFHRFVVLSQIEYYEIGIPLRSNRDLLLCKYLKAQHLHYSGYLPAFHYGKKREEFYDVIVFTFYKENHFNPNNLKLILPVKTLLDRMLLTNQTVFDQKISNRPKIGVNIH